MDNATNERLTYHLADERADVEALVELVTSIQQRWENRISPEAAKKLWQHNKFDPNAWSTLKAAYLYEMPVHVAASLHAALTELKNAMDFLADPPTGKPNLKLKPYRDAAAREQADLLR